MPGDTHHQSQSASATTFTSEALPTVWNARGSRKTCSKKHQNIDDAKNLGNNGILSFYVHDSHGRERDSTVQASKIIQNDRSHTGYKSDDPSRSEKSHLLVESEYEPGREWIEQAEPGVYITLVALPGGGKDLKRVRFSRKRFSEKQAEVWWRENKARVHELYDVRLTGTSATIAAAP